MSLFQLLLGFRKRKDSDEVVDLTIEHEIPIGEEGESAFSDSALARPFRVLVEEGRNTGKINHLFLFISNRRFVLGSLCHTPKGRLIFFPGIIGRKMLWDSEKGNLGNHGVLDHVTLEPNLNKWHLTVFQNGRKSKSIRLPDRFVTPVEPSLIYWFGMSVRSPSFFETLFKKYRFSFSSVPDNGGKSVDILSKARNGSVFQELSLNGLGQELVLEGEFLHFDFLIDQRKKGSPLPHNLTSIPIGPPALKEISEKTKDFQMRGHEIEIPGFNGRILVLVSKNKGELTKEVMIGSGPSPLK